MHTYSLIDIETHFTRGECLQLDIPFLCESVCLSACPDILAIPFKRAVVCECLSAKLYLL